MIKLGYVTTFIGNWGVTTVEGIKNSQRLLPPLPPKFNVVVNTGFVILFCRPELAPTLISGGRGGVGVVVKLKHPLRYSSGVACPISEIKSHR